MNPEKEKLASTILAKLLSKTSNRGVDLGVETTININNLRALIDVECTDSNVISALIEINQQEDKNLFAFIHAVRNEIARKEKANNETTWNIVIPFDLELNKRRIEINDNTFKIVKYSSLGLLSQTKYYVYIGKEKTSPERIPDTIKRYLIVTSKGENLQDAWKSIEPSFNAVKGLLDFSLSYNTWTYFQSNLNARTKIPHPEFIYGYSSLNNSAYIQFFVNKSQKQTKKLTKNQLHFINKITGLLKLKTDKGTIESFISDLFRLYSEAMDQNLFHQSYLRFWQILERIADPELLGISIVNNKNRISYFVKEAYSSDLSAYVDSLFEKRNNLVHRGIDEIETDDITFIKNLSERIIIWIFNNRHIFSSCRHLELFYNNIFKNNSDLSISNKVIIKILKSRRK